MNSSVTLSNRQRRALADMGIDLWVRRVRGDVAQPAPRTEVTDSTRSIPSSPELTPEPIAVGTVARAAGDQARTQTAPSVQLECLAAPGAVLIGAFANSTDRRFAQDILLAVAGIGAAVQRTQFRWPQTQTGDASLAAARSAYMGFLRGQTERAGARCLLLLGDAAQALLDSPFAVNDCSLLRLRDAGALRGDAAGKKALWLTISPLARG
jgi:hypothetical protein